MKKIINIITLVIILTFILPACSPKDKKLMLADTGVDSARFSNAVLGIIAEEVFGYSKYESTGGTHKSIHEGLINNEIDVALEVWTDNIDSYYDDFAEEKFSEWGTVTNDGIQGFYVPRYVIEGDVERGIEAMAPGLKTVADLAEYKDVFADNSQEGLGRIYGCVELWSQDDIYYKKYLYYGLDKTYVYYRPGSQKSMNEIFVEALENGKPIVGYCMDPSFITGKYDMVLLEESIYEEEGYRNGETASPNIKLTKVTSNNLATEDKKFCEFLIKFNIPKELIVEALIHMEETGESFDETAKWFLKVNDSVIDEWLSADEAEILRKSFND